MSKEKKLGATFAGITSTNLYEVSFEDKKKPSENGLGFSTMICAPDEETARKWFAKAEPDCEIKDVIEREGVLMPLFEMENPLNRRLNEYQAQAMTTCLPSSNNDAYMLLNLNGEVGELNSKIAKAIRKGYMHFDEENNLQLSSTLEETEEGMELVKGIIHEAGDVLWQLSGFCKTFTDAELGVVAAMNLDKLAARKDAGTIDGNGDGVSGKERTV